MSSTLIENRIEELKRELIPDATDPRDILHNEGIREYIEMYEAIIAKMAKETTNAA